MIPAMPVLLGMSQPDVERELRHPGACEIQVRGSAGCTMMSCCDDLESVVPLQGVCGRVRWGGVRWVAAVAFEEGRAVHVLFTPDTPPTSEQWVSGEVIDTLRYADGDALHLLGDGTVVRTGGDGTVRRVEIVASTHPDQAPECRSPLRATRREPFDVPPPPPDLGAVILSTDPQSSP